jgi:hypothetical protein
MYIYKVLRIFFLGKIDCKILDLEIFNLAYKGLYIL